MVLGAAVKVFASGAGSDTHSVSALVIAVELGLELTARIVLEETALVAVLAETSAKQRRSLLGNSGTEELNKLLPHDGVVGVERPASSSVRGRNVPLSLGGAASKNSSAALTGGQGGSFSKIDLVSSLDEAINSERRLGDGERELDATRGSSVGNAELERARLILNNAAKVKWLP